MENSIPQPSQVDHHDQNEAENFIGFGNSFLHQQQRQSVINSQWKPTACYQCRAAHVACDKKRPCIRCVRLCKDCSDVDDTNRASLIPPSRQNPEKAAERQMQREARMLDDSGSAVSGSGNHSTYSFGNSGLSAGTIACNNCRIAHVACDRGRPCGRCVRLALAATCNDPPSGRRMSVSSGIGNIQGSSQKPLFSAPVAPVSGSTATTSPQNFAPNMIKNPSVTAMSVPVHVKEQQQYHYSNNQYGENPFIGGIPFYHPESSLAMAYASAIKIINEPSKTLEEEEYPPFAFIEQTRRATSDFVKSCKPELKSPEIPAHFLMKCSSSTSLNVYPTPSATPPLSKGKITVSTQTDPFIPKSIMETATYLRL